MPDLGSYAVYVLSAYGGSLALIIGLCARSVLRARRVRADMDALEARARR